MKKCYVWNEAFRLSEELAPHSWICVEEPDEADLGWLAEELGVPQNFIDSASDPDERPHIDSEEGWLLTILRIPISSRRKEWPYETVPISIISNGEILLTVCLRKAEMMADFISNGRCDLNHERAECDFILRIIDHSTGWYLKYLEKLNREMIANEKQLERSVRNEDLYSLIGLQRTIVYFSTSIQGNESLLDRLQTVYGDDYDHDFSDDVRIELHQAVVTTNIYAEIMGNTLGNFASIVSNNVNNIMKKMTSLSMVLMVPTMIASFFGMNVAIPGEDRPMAFVIIILGSFVLSAILYVFLRKIRWF